MRRLALIATWVLIAYMGFAASQMHEEFKPDFDPFEIMGVDRADFTDFDSFKKPAKKLYRDLSRTLHPDKKCAEWMKVKFFLKVEFLPKLGQVRIEHKDESCR